MEAVFPFGFPASTAAYLVLYVATFAVHQFFMHYVLAGCLYIAWCAVFPGRSTCLRDQQPLAELIREWLPFLLSAAITAGVAPLLFVQIVYPRHFYTANLLLSWKWLVVVPVLIIAFYLLYLLKSRIISRWSLVFRTTVSLATASCFVFVGFCWTANHLLGNAESSWANIYETGTLNLGTVTVLTRMLVWISGSFASLSVFTAWQLKAQASRSDVTRMAVMAIGGIVISCVAGGMYLVQVDSGVRSSLQGALGGPYVVLVFLGSACQLLSWWTIRSRRKIEIVPLTFASLGLVLSLIGVSVVREVIRLEQLNISTLYAFHSEASQIGGASVFAVFAVINTALIGYCVWLVRSGVAVVDDS